MLHSSLGLSEHQELPAELLGRWLAMVVKGRGKFPAKKQVEKPPPTKNITKIASLTKQPGSDKALELLHEIATLVAPIMHHYHFQVDLLCEMYPRDRCLLGLNVNRGQKICLRLRSPTDNKWFLDRESIVGTMLHELTHNLHGPHDDRFYKTLDALKDKYYEFQINESLKVTSYPNNFAHPRSPAQVTKPTYTTKVTKLGTNKIKNNSNRVSTNLMRRLMLEAAERRRNDAKKCGELEADKLKNVPADDDLCVLDVISLDSDDEKDLTAKDGYSGNNEEDSTVKKNSKNGDCIKQSTQYTRTLAPVSPKSKNNVDVIVID